MHGSVRNVLELCGGLAEEVFFLQKIARRLEIRVRGREHVNILGLGRE